jgi:hypothetical protein
MAEQAEKVATRKLKLKNVSKRGNRVVFDIALKQHLIPPGGEAEVEVAEPEAKRMEEASKAGSDLQVDGNEPEKQEGAPEVQEVQKTRPALAEAERDELEAGAEADKERREKDAKKSGAQLAAETGIHMHARGETPETVTAPPDAPPKKKA